MLKKLLLAIATLVVTMGFAFAQVDVNKADQATLDSVKGIGPAKSKAIIEERKKGSFKDWADFENRVKGIGEKNSSTLSEAGLTVNGQSKSGSPATKEARKEAKAEAKEAKKETKADAKAEAKDAKADAKDAKKDAKAEAKETKKDAKADAKEVKKDAKADAKKAKAEAKEAKEAKKDTKADAKDAKKEVKKEAKKDDAKK